MINTRSAHDFPFINSYNASRAFAAKKITQNDFTLKPLESQTRQNRRDKKAFNKKAPEMIEKASEVTECLGMANLQTKGQFGPSRSVYLDSVGLISNYLPSEDMNCCVDNLMMNRDTEF